ncbi:hypothetical protein GF362_06660 [Candidatus Dojkabacteria bacterium]|nr:hypothetical protein [Candidatus Dojkabacteria bacterium]
MEIFRPNRYSLAEALGQPLPMDTVPPLEFIIDPRIVPAKFSAVMSTPTALNTHIGTNHCWSCPNFFQNLCGQHLFSSQTEEGCFTVNITGK